MKETFIPSFGLLISGETASLLGQCTVYSDQESEIIQFETEDAARAYAEAHQITIITEEAEEPR